MLLTAPLLAKSSFFGSLINKCRQVTKILPEKTATNHKKNNNDDNIDKIVEHVDGTATISSKSFTPCNVINPIDPNNNNIDYSNRPVAVANLSLSTATSAKTLEEKIGLPPRPKKPLTPYFRYMQDLRPKLLAENPDYNITEVVSMISKRWKTVEPQLKERLFEEYKRDRQHYIELRTKYDAKLTEEQRAEIKQLKQDIVDMKERRMLRKRIKDLGRPKKPISAYLLFIAKERIETPQTAKQTYRDWHQKATAKWTRLSDAEKEVFLQTARKEIEKYK